NLRRYAFPLMIQAGKYLGKRLLTSGRNIVEEVSQGKSFRNAARDQLRQSGREITTDILRKLKGGGIRKDLGTQPRLLISGTTIRVRLLKAKDEFTLLAKSGNYRLQIENISLFIRKCDVSSSILVGHERR
ncbi:uncharacterized protein TNCV_4036781, partial [Trichonephila clavipes]